MSGLEIAVPTTVTAGAWRDISTLGSPRELIYVGTTGAFAFDVSGDGVDAHAVALPDTINGTTGRIITDSSASFIRCRRTTGTGAGTLFASGNPSGTVPQIDTQHSWALVTAQAAPAAFAVQNFRETMADNELLSSITMEFSATVVTDNTDFVTFNVWLKNGTGGTNALIGTVNTTITGGVAFNVGQRVAIPITGGPLTLAAPAELAFSTVFGGAGKALPAFRLWTRGRVVQ